MNQEAYATQPVRLGIPGLPSLTDSLVPGGLYLLIAETASARFPILTTTLANAIQNGQICTVVMPQNPEVFIQRVSSSNKINVAQACGQNQIRLFLMQEEFTKKMFRHGADAFVQELSHFGIDDGGYLLFDQADNLLSLHDVTLALDQVETIGRWAEEHKVTILMTLSRTTDTNTSTINALMDELNGVARLGVSRSGLELSFDYWQSVDGTIAGRNFILSTLESGLYEVGSVVGELESSGSEAKFERIEEPAPHEAKFFYMDPDLSTLAKQMQGQWQRIDTLVGMMHATRSLRVATCILMFKRDTDLRELAETIHTLRISMGRYARIVVQEKSASLRYQNEALLLKLGLSLAINRDVPLSRFPLLLDSLKGQIFSRNVDINFDAALTSVLPSRLYGYVPATRFVKETLTIVDRAETLDIPCALVIGEPTVDTSLESIVTHNGISRPGDLITTSNEECFIFLNACPQAALLSALERVLKMPPDAAFASVRFVVSREEIQVELASLDRLAERENIVDFSDLVSNPSLQAEDAEPAQAVQTVISTLSKPAQTIAPPPASPVTTSLFADRPIASPVKKPSITELPATPHAVAVATLRTNQVAAVVTPAAHAPSTGAGAMADNFEYDGLTNVKNFGKSEAPRARRSASSSRSY